MASNVTMATVQRISAAALAQEILAGQGAPNPKLAIVDVRDDDFVGGSIKGAQNVPSSQLDARLPTLVQQLRDKETVVFHCALSQQRGPSAAIRYLRQRERTPPHVRSHAAAGTTAENGQQNNATPDEQQVLVLDRGFVGWQEMYGGDERLTEGYRKEVWENGY